MKNTGYIIVKLLLLVAINMLFVQAIAIEDYDEHANLFDAPKVANGSVLTVKDCVALAFKNSPVIRRKKYELDIARNNVGIAKSKYFPVIGAGVGFNYARNSNSIYYDKKYRDLPYVGIALNQLIFDFGKTTAYINMEKFYRIGAEFEFVDELCHTLFHIKQRYYNLLRKLAVVQIAKKDVELCAEFLKLSKDNQAKSTAEVYLSEAKINLINANRELENAKFDLSNAMYLDNHINYLIGNTPTFDFDINKNLKNGEFIPVSFPFKVNEAPEIAYNNSPDLQVIISTKNAMVQNLKFIKRSFLPDLTGTVGYSYNHTYNASNNGFQVGLGLSTEINLKELIHNIDSAHAEVDIADNEILLFKKDLYYEVQRAFNNMDMAEKQLYLAIEEMNQAQNNLKLVVDAYKAGKVDYIALQNSRKDYINSKGRYVLSLYDYNMAIIQTEMSLHYHIADIQHTQDHALHSHADELLEHFNDILKNETGSRNKKHKRNKSVKCST